MPPISGKVYKLIDVQSTTLLTLDVIDRKVNGWRDLDGENQKWRVTHEQDQWVLTSLYRDPHAPHAVIFLNIESSPGQGTRVIGSSTRAGWDIYDHWGSTFSVFFHASTTFLIDLSGGKGDDGTVVQLWSNVNNNHPGQHWLFQEVKDA